MKKGMSQKEEDKVLDERDALQAQRYALCREGDSLWRASTEISRAGNVREYGRTCWTYKQTGGKEKVEKCVHHSSSSLRTSSMQLCYTIAFHSFMNGRR